MPKDVRTTKELVETIVKKHRMHYGRIVIDVAHGKAVRVQFDSVPFKLKEEGHVLEKVDLGYEK
jgi:hypothetical protein